MPAGMGLASCLPMGTPTREKFFTLPPSRASPRGPMMSPTDGRPRGRMNSNPWRVHTTTAVICDGKPNLPPAEGSGVLMTDTWFWPPTPFAAQTLGDKADSAFCVAMLRSFGAIAPCWLHRLESWRRTTHSPPSGVPSLTHPTDDPVCCWQSTHPVHGVALTSCARCGR